MLTGGRLAGSVTAVTPECQLFAFCKHVACVCAKPNTGQLVLCPGRSLLASDVASAYITTVRAASCAALMRATPIAIIPCVQRDCFGAISALLTAKEQ